MKLRTTLVLLTLLFSSLVLPARADKLDEKRRGPKVERKIAADAAVSVSACISSGSIKVNGWDRNEVRARSLEAAEIELKRKDEGSGLAKKIEVLVGDKAEDMSEKSPCEAFSEIELDVPRGATLQLQTRDSDIEVSDVATVYVNTQNGTVTIARATRNVDAGTIGGDISLMDSSGRINLHTAGGSIDVNNVKPAEAGDTFEAKSLGGDITLDQVTHAQLNANTLNGSLCMTGALAAGGRYNFRTMSGDMTLTMPEDSSFQLSARFSQKAEIITDFPIKLMSQASAKPAPVPHPAPVTPAMPATPAPNVKSTTPNKEDMPDVVTQVKTKKGTVIVDVTTLTLRRLEGVCGTGDAKLELASFSGTIHLQKQ
jgi:hypothetical protein